MVQAQKIRRKTAYHHGDLRAQLIEATRALVEEKGPDHFSVSEAARKAGVSTAAPYRHFKDREEMLDAVCRDGMRRHFGLMVEALDGVEPGTRDRLMALGKVYVAFALREPGVFRLIFGSKQRAPETDVMDEEDVRPFELVQEEVASALQRDEIDADVVQRAFMLWTFVHGLSFLLLDNVPAHKGLAVDVEQMLRELGLRLLPEAAR